LKKEKKKRREKRKEKKKRKKKRKKEEKKDVRFEIKNRFSITHTLCGKKKKPKNQMRQGGISVSAKRYLTSKHLLKKKKISPTFFFLPLDLFINIHIWP
jgi:hypothetical protein